MQGDLTPEQFDKVLQLCSILGLQDFCVATSLLKESNWNIEKAIGVEQQHNYAPKASAPQPVNNLGNNNIAEEQVYQDYNYQNFDDVPLDYNFNQNQQEANEFQAQYQYYQQQIQKNERIENKKKMFNEGFVSIPLVKTKSEFKGDNIQARLQPKGDIEKGTGNRIKQQYQTDLLKNSSLLCSRIFAKKSAQLQRYKQSLKNQQNNRKFISHIHNHYNSPINFTFGSFYLQLARSHLAKKPLLVYIHNSQFEDNKSLHLLLSQKQVANFVNKNCVCFGMFDSADDYQILQKYVQIKDLPAFVLFKLDNKDLVEKLVGTYSVVGKEGKGFLDWLAQMTGVQLPKKIKQENKEKEKIAAQSSSRIEISNIIFQQNFEYEEMARLHQIKRNKSKLRKEEAEKFQQEIEQLRKSFTEQPLLEPGVSIQIRFRLPVTGDSLLRVFKLNQLVDRMFNYIHCFGREEFENQMANFDLTQTFPKLSLQDKKQMKIGDVFQDGAERQNLIVKEL